MSENIINLSMKLVYDCLRGQNVGKTASVKLAVTCGRCMAQAAELDHEGKTVDLTEFMKLADKLTPNNKTL